MDSSDPETVQTASEDEEEEAEDIQELGQKVANYLFDSHSLGIVVKKVKSEKTQKLSVSQLLIAMFIDLQGDLIKNCLERNQRKYYNHVLDRARSLIRSTFGYDVKEGQHNQDHLLFLVDTQAVDGNSIDDSQLKRRQTLLFLILGYITMKTPPVPEASVINFLEKLEISMIDDPDFGNVKDLLTKEFPHQYYLKPTKQLNQATGEQK